MTLYQEAKSDERDIMKHSFNTHVDSINDPSITLTFVNFLPSLNSLSHIHLMPFLKLSENQSDIDARNATADGTFAPGH